MLQIIDENDESEDRSQIFNSVYKRENRSAAIRITTTSNAVFQEGDNVINESMTGDHDEGKEKQVHASIIEVIDDNSSSTPVKGHSENRIQETNNHTQIQKSASTLNKLDLKIQIMGSNNIGSGEQM